MTQDPENLDFLQDDGTDPDDPILQKLQQTKFETAWRALCDKQNQQETYESETPITPELIARRLALHETLLYSHITERFAVLFILTRGQTVPVIVNLNDLAGRLFLSLQNFALLLRATEASIKSVYKVITPVGLLFLWHADLSPAKDFRYEREDDNLFMATENAAQNGARKKAGRICGVLDADAMRLELEHLSGLLYESLFQPARVTVPDTERFIIVPDSPADLTLFERLAQYSARHEKFNAELHSSLADWLRSTFD